MNRPMLFSTLMVESILSENKTMTRRIVKPQPMMDGSGMWHWKDCQWMDGGMGFPQSGVKDYAPWHPGDVLWVRETWNDVSECGLGHFVYRADYRSNFVYACDIASGAYPSSCRGKDCDFCEPFALTWRPSILMPKKACRLFLCVSSVRMERLQRISNKDALAEGVEVKDWPFDDTPREMFEYLWDSLNAKRSGGAYSWAMNPWVWVISFERCEKPNCFGV